MSPNDADLARAYGVHRKQVGRWRDRGLAVESPAELLEQLAMQGRPGAILDRLSKPEVLAATTTAIHQLTSR